MPNRCDRLTRGSGARVQYREPVPLISPLDPFVASILPKLRARRAHIGGAVRRIPWLGPLMIRMVRSARSMVAFRPERFERLYRQRHDTDDLDSIADPVRRMHADFALSTVRRGVRARDQIAAHTSIKGKRYLDVGCAYGGFLVAFAQAGARQVVGIDINPRLLEYARALLEDYDVEAQVECIDVLSAPRSSALGRFDIVTCNDVIEHVRDPGATLDRLVDLLDEGGTLFMQIPNRHSASFVLSDGHYRIFGLTALPKQAADRLFKELTSKRHDVTYKSLPFYINRLAHAGATSRVINPMPWNLGGRLEEIAATFDACESKLADPNPRTSPGSRVSLERHVRRLASLYRRQLSRHRALKRTDPSAARTLAARMWLYFGCDFWEIVVTKQNTQ